MTPHRSYSTYGAFRVAFQNGQCPHICHNQLTHICRECGHMCTRHALAHNTKIIQVHDEGGLDGSAAVLAVTADIPILYAGDGLYWDESRATEECAKRRVTQTAWVEHQDPITWKWSKW